MNAQELSPLSLFNEPYFDIYNTLLDKENVYMNSKYEDSYLTAMGYIYAWLGHQDKSLDYYILRNRKMKYIPDTLKDVNFVNCGISQDSLSYLYNKYNVVMFNENHYSSQHRAFLYSQLEVLKRIGYNQLALETIDENDTLLENRKYPTYLTGFYTKDPVYGNVIRKALELGFTLIPYDNVNQDREKGQADNIFRQYDPKNGKLIVYGGYGHTCEKGNFMGKYLKEYLNEDILTISQFIYYIINPIIGENNPSDLFLEKDKTAQFDFMLYAKPKAQNYNLPFWYKDWMNFKSVALDKIYNKQLIYPTLVQIYNNNEEAGIPVYQYLIEKEEKILIPYPKKGKYILKIENKEGLIEKNINLK
jgi:hypothetical protein